MSANRGSAPVTPSGRGRPDERFPHPPVTTKALRDQEVTVSVVARVNLTKNVGQIRFVNPIPGGRTFGTAEKSQVMLRVSGQGGHALRNYPIAVKLDSELSREDDRQGLVDAVIPIDAGARTIELVLSGRVAHSWPLGGPVPAIRGVQRLVTDDDTELRFGLVVDGPLQEGSSYYAQVSTDRGKTWQTIGVGLKEPVFAMDRRQFHKGDEVQVRVVATNGLSSSTVTTETFRV